jgi:hypothetical protein
MRSATVSLKSLPSIDAGALGSIRGCRRFSSSLSAKMSPTLQTELRIWALGPKL